MGFRLDTLPQPPAIFGLIERLGDVPLAELFYTFNMGVGFCVVLPASECDGQ